MLISVIGLLVALIATSTLFTQVLQKGSVEEPRTPPSTILVIFGFVIMFSIVMTASVMTENGPVGLLCAYTLLVFSPILTAHERITPAFSKELYRQVFRFLYWVVPKLRKRLDPPGV